MAVSTLSHLDAQQTTSATKRLVEVRRRGGDEDTILTTPVRSVIPFGDGVAVLLPNEARVVVLNRQLEFVRQVGRSGAGPGEFGIPSGLYPVDSGQLAVADIERRRVSVFSSDGKHLSTIRTDGFRVPMGGPWWSITAIAPNADGLVPVIVSRGPVAPAETVSFVPGPRLIALPGREPIRSPFVDIPAWAVPSRSLAVVHIVRIDVGNQLTVQSLSTSGEITTSVRFHASEIPASPDWYDAKIDSMVRNDREFRRTRDEFTRHLKRPRVFPVVQRVLAGEDGSVWIQRMVAAGTPSRFLVVEGQRVTEVVGPAGLRVLSANRGRVFGTIRTENGADVLIEFQVVSKGD